MLGVSTGEGTDFLNITNCDIIYFFMYLCNLNKNNN